MNFGFKLIALLFFTLSGVLALCATSPTQEVPSNSIEGKQFADSIVIVKSTRTMILENNGHVLKTYKVALGGEPVGAKERQGDHKTPEGKYLVDAKNGHSQFYLALHISYPNATDRARARKLGASPGGDVEIHGLGKKYGWIGARHRLTDWTDGCVAVTNEEIEEIFKMVAVGTPVEFRP
jgi:murein L,D-transpeptidase YafK